MIAAVAVAAADGMAIRKAIPKRLAVVRASPVIQGTMMKMKIGAAAEAGVGMATRKAMPKRPASDGKKTTVVADPGHAPAAATKMKTSIVAGVVVAVVVADGMAIRKVMPKPPASAGKTMIEGAAPTGHDPAVVMKTKTTNAAVALAPAAGTKAAGSAIPKATHGLRVAVGGIAINIQR